MRNMLRCALVVATLATLTLANSAGAATILIFGQTSNTDVITETISGGTTTLTTGPGSTASSIAASITNIGGIMPPGGSLAGFETFTLTSTGSGFSGTIVFSQLPNGGGLPILTVTVTNGVLSLNGGAAGFTSNSSVFTNYNPAIVAQVGPPPTMGATSLSFVNVTGTGTGFTAQNSGLFSTAVPEPASIVMGSFALLTGLGFFGLRRLKASRA